MLYKWLRMSVYVDIYSPLWYTYNVILEICRIGGYRFEQSDQQDYR